MKYALVYGLISGGVSILTLIAGVELTGPGSFVRTNWFGYLLMLVVLTFVFVGIKRYRDLECGGVIRFGRAFLVGLGIAAFAGLAFVLVFEVYLAATGYRFYGEYAAQIVRDGQAAGASTADIARDVATAESFRDNPLLRIPVTFLLIFPLALLVALISAALLRNPRVLPATGRAKSLSGNEVNPDLQPHS